MFLCLTWICAVLMPAAEGKDDAPLSVFDRIERDDNEELSWEEFESYFVTSGALTGNGKPTGASIRVRGGRSCGG